MEFAVFYEPLPKAKKALRLLNLELWTVDREP